MHEVVRALTWVRVSCGNGCVMGDVGTPDEEVREAFLINEGGEALCAGWDTKGRRILLFIGAAFKTRECEASGT